MSKYFYQYRVVYRFNSLIFEQNLHFPILSFIHFIIYTFYHLYLGVFSFQHRFVLKDNMEVFYSCTFLIAHISGHFCRSSAYWPLKQLGINFDTHIAYWIDSEYFDLWTINEFAVQIFPEDSNQRCRKNIELWYRQQIPFII